YIGVYLYYSDTKKIVSKSSVYDSSQVFDDDFITVNLDPQHDHRTVYSFTTNPKGTQVDGKGLNNGKVFQTSWDTVWKVKTHRFEEGWTAEFEIPFSSLDYDPKSKNELGLNLTRQIANKSELAVWAPILPPFVFALDLEASQFGHLKGIELLSHSWRRLNF